MNGLAVKSIEKVLGLGSFCHGQSLESRWWLGLVITFYNFNLLDKATKGTYLQMFRDVKFVVDYKSFRLQIQPEI
jgi:hypothetical protein